MTVTDKKTCEISFLDHPCEIDGGDSEHDWVFVDDSYDHAFGTEYVRFWECRQCGETRDAAPDECCDYEKVAYF